MFNPSAKLPSSSQRAWCSGDGIGSARCFQWHNTQS